MRRSKLLANSTSVRMAQININSLCSIERLRAAHHGISQISIVKAPLDLIIYPFNISERLIVFVKVKLIHILHCAFVLVIVCLI